MGMMIAEQQQQQQQQQQQTAVVRADEVVGKKSRRRSNRRSKQNASLNGSASIEEVGDNQQTSQGFQNDNMTRNGSLLKQHGQNKASNVAFNSLPTIHMDEQGSNRGPGVRVFSNSCPSPNTFNESGEVRDEGDLIPSYLVDGCNKQKRFDSHWSPETVNEALQRGEIFQAMLRVNAHNRLEAYCTIEGVPTDVLISGIPLQNRAVEGDVVAVKVDPPSYWIRMKGSIGSSNNPSSADNCDPSDSAQINHDNLKGKNKVDAVTNHSPGPNNGFYDISNANGTICQESARRRNDVYVNGHHLPCMEPLREGCSQENIAVNSVEKLCQTVMSFPSKRPTGRVVAIVEPSPRRNAIVGFLNVKWWLSSRGGSVKDNRKNANLLPLAHCDYVQLTPTDPRFPKMIVPLRSLPDDIKKRLNAGDASIETELVAAQVDHWPEESSLPHASVIRSFGRGGEVEPRIASILFENTICCSEFAPESLTCLPHESWQVPQAEIECRKDIRNLCVFTIDPSTATDLDDALSVERLPSGIYRVGVHIADVSYFVQPDTALDMEAQFRSTSVYMLRRKLPMLPPLLSENLGSLNPGVERLAFSIFWDMDLSGKVLDRWVGRTVIRSCCKLSYEHAQDIIDGLIDVESLNCDCTVFPQLHGNFDWVDVFQSLRSLHDISKALKHNRFNDGALRLDNAKVVFVLDELGVPYDSMLCERKDSNFLVEEFMLLANRTAAEIIARAFPHSALLRRHPEPNLRKLKELQAFCSKHGLVLDTSSSGNFHLSLEKIREKLKDDSVLYDILINFATKPMQLAKYFCSGDVKVGEDDWGHYALAVPLYTHFTSPLRRFPDIVVHRTLIAAIEAELAYWKCQNKVNKFNQAGDGRCFTGLNFDELAAQSAECQQTLSSAALKHRVPCTEVLEDVASYCNQKKLASRNVKDAVDKLYMWNLLKNKEILVSEARVLGIGPRFMSIYVQKLAIERRIYFDDVDGLMVEWLEATSTLVLSYVHNNNKRSQRRGSPGKWKALEEVALIGSSCNSEEQDDDSINEGGDCRTRGQCTMEVTPVVFPLTIQVLSTIPVALHAVGGDDGPLDIAARLFVSSYFR